MALIERSGHEWGPKCGEWEPHCGSREKSGPNLTTGQEAGMQAAVGRMDCDALEAEVDSREDMQEDSPCKVPIPSTVTTATS